MNLMDLFVKISVDDQASSQVETIGSKLKGGLVTAAKVGAAAVAAAGTAIVAIGKQAIEQYAEYEQLVGGVETLFKQSADTVMVYAENAYKTAGLSANEYMNTVTSFSASLLQSLGGDTEAAAEYADMAITDMADNANKMGTSMEMIQNAYQGFAKGNMTMLDNLKLGYGGTKEEMQRLLEDAEKLSGIEYDISSYADIVDAIHVVQTEMGITGTTAKEAATTIQGSVSAMKSAWKNLVTGIAEDNADLDRLVTNFVDSLETASGNIVPRITKILSGIGKAIEKIAPILAEQVPEILVEAIPTMISAGAKLLIGLVEGLLSAIPKLAESIPQIIDSIITSVQEALPRIVESGGQILSQLVSGIESGLPNMVERIPVVIDTFLTYISENLPVILDEGVTILETLINGIINSIPALLDALPQVINSFVQFITDNLPVIVNSGIRLLRKLIDGIIKTIPELVESLPEIIVAIVEGIGDLLGSIVDVGKNIVEGIWQGIKNAAKWLKDKITGFFDGIIGGVKDFLGIHSPSRVFADMGKNMALGIGEGWDNQYDSIKKDIESGMIFDAGTITADANISKKYASGSYGAASGIRDSGRIVMLLEQYLPMLANMKVIMDSGQVVGLLAPGMDEELAKINARRARTV